MPAKSIKRLYASPWFARGHVNVFSTPQTTQTNVVQLLEDTRDAGSDNGSWRYKIKKHISATTNLSGVRWKVERNKTYGSVSQKLRSSDGTDLEFHPDVIVYKGDPQPTRVATLHGLASSSVVADTAKREAVRKYFRKVAAVEKQMSGLTTLGELRETLRMLRNPAKSLFDSARKDYIDALKRRKHLSPRNWAKGLSGAYLEWVFGLTPLINDLKDAFDALERFNSDLVRFKVITAVGNHSETFATNFYTWSAGNDLWFEGTATRIARQKHKYRALYMRQVDEIKNLTSAGRLNELLGFKLSEFVPTAWELLPWSFLVDYFSNVGDILEQSFASVQNVRWVNHTRVNFSQVKARANLDRTATQNAIFFAGFSQMVSANPGPDARCFISKESWTRDAETPSVQSLRFELPGSPQKWLNMAALAIQANTVHPQQFNFRR